jgi:hypothetical protein
VDPTATTGFVHGAATGEVNSALAALPPPVDPVASGIVKPSQGEILSTVSNITSTSEFEVSLTIRTADVMSAGNILRVSPWRIEDCRPCISLNAQGNLVAHIYYSEKGWWKFAPISQQLLANTDYSLKVVLHDRRLRLFVDQGLELTQYPQIEASVGLSLAGEFPRPEPCVVYAGKDDNGNIADVFVYADSLRVAKTVFSHRTFSFDFDDGLLSNSVRFHMGFEAPSLTHASEIAAYSDASPSKAVLTAAGYAGSGAEFDRHSALVLQSSEGFSVDGDVLTGFTLCLWMKRTLPLDTLYTTIAGFGSDVVVNYAAYFADVAFATRANQLRASPTSLADPKTHWTHVCASGAPGGNKILYINGTRVAAAELAPDTLVTSSLFALGANIDPAVYAATGNDRGFGGVIDEVNGWGRQLSDREVEQVYTATGY